MADTPAFMEGMTERQKKWFATVQANFEAQTGKPMAEWVALVRRDAPEGSNRVRMAWLKAAHGIGINHASFILSQAYPSADPGWDDPATLRAQLWKDPGSLAILEAIDAAAKGIDGLVSGQRKGYTSWSRAVQFAAARPLKGGRALLGLKLDPAASARLSPAARKESWSERLVATVELGSAVEVDAEIVRVFAEAAKNG